MDVLNWIGDFASGIATLAGDTIEIGRLNMKVKEEELKISRLKKEIGEHIYKQFETGDSLQTEINELCEKIKDAKASIEIIKDGLTRVKSQTKAHANDVININNNGACRDCGSVEHETGACKCEEATEAFVEETAETFANADLNPFPAEDFVQENDDTNTEF